MFGMNSMPILPPKVKRTVPKEFKRIAKKMAKQPRKTRYGQKTASSGYRGP